MSRLQLKPQGATVLPLDKQRLIIEASPPPALWHTISNGQIQADSRLQIVTAPGTVSGSSGNALYSGGRLSWTINDNQRPTSSGSLIYSAFNSDASLKFEVQITSSQIIVKNEIGTTIFSTPYTPTTGDIFAILIGDVFRLIQNTFNELFVRGGTPPISFPCTYTASLTTPVVGASPAIAPPTFIGDWKIAPNAPFIFSIIAGNGILTPISPISIEYSGNTIAGDIPVNAQLAQAQDPFSIQRASSVLSTPSLRILGESAISLQPGQKIRPKTNYDTAKTLTLIAWSIVSGGGTFANGEFTAPTAPGVTILRATSATTNQIADLTITVPAVITPERTGYAAGEIVDWVTNLTSPVWAASAGSINPGTGLWTAPQLPIATARITATSGGVVATRDVDILEKFPRSDFILPWSIDFAKRALVSEAEDGSRTSRIKVSARRSFPVSLLVDAVADIDGRAGLATIRDFWDRHHPGVKFIMEDPEEVVRLVVYSDSDLRWEHTSAGINIAFRVKQA